MLMSCSAVFIAYRGNDSELSKDRLAVKDRCAKLLLKAGVDVSLQAWSGFEGQDIFTKAVTSMSIVNISPTL